MLHVGKCPGCEHTISYAKVEAIELRVSADEVYKGLTYCCPSCHRILGTEAYPVALKVEIVSSILRDLDKGSVNRLEPA
jgi:hypothetical protein